MIKSESLNSESCRHVTKYEFDQYWKYKIPKSHTKLHMFKWTQAGPKIRYDYRNSKQ